MKKAISAVLLAVFVSSYASPVLAQKTALPDRTKQPLTRKQPQRSEPQLAAPRSTRFGPVGAYTDGAGVFVAWEMEAEVGNIGYNVYRLDKNGTELLNPAKLVTGGAVHATASPRSGGSYSFFHPAGTGDEVYYVEAIGIDGTYTRTQTLHPYYVSSLKTISGKTSTELAETTNLTPGQTEDSIVQISKELIEEIGDYQFVPDPVMHRTVISQPGVARIGVRGAGLYRVTRAQLQAAGFDVNSNSTNWQLYVEGVQQPMIIGNNADYIEFYGKGTDTREADIRQYYLMNGTTAGARIGTRVARPDSGTVTTPSYAQFFTLEENSNYIDDVYNGELENYFGRGIGTTTSTINFNLTGVDFAVPTSSLFVKFQGYSLGYHVIEVSINDNVLPPSGSTTTSGEVSFSSEYLIPTSHLREGANSIKFRGTGPSDFVFFDEMNIGYNRKFIAQQNRLNFLTQNFRRARLEGFTSANVRVFDMTYENAPTLVTNLNFQSNGSSFGVNLPPARGRLFYAVEDSAILTPTSVTANNPELVGVDGPGFDAIIISHGNYMTQAEAWATYRRSAAGGNFTVKVVEISELYDEFNYGTHSATAIRSYLQYARIEWDNAPDYVLLIGDASVDPRNYENQGNWDMVPTMIVSAVVTEVASDDSLADFDNDGLGDMAFGRIASRNVTGITNIFNKTVKWETHVNPHTRGVLFAYDHSDQFYNFGAISNNVMSGVPGDIPKTSVFRGEANANANLLASMNAGKWMVNYTGHGTTGSWGGNPVFFNILSVPTLQENENNPAVFTMLTCLNGAFHYLFNDSFSEVLTKANNKGAVAAWASTGLTIATTQETMGVRYYQKAGDGTIPRLGDIIRDAKLNGGAADDVRKSWNLVGDPMLKVR